jgi:hypothetical protein
MTFKDFILGFFVSGSIVLVVSLVVAYLYGLLAHGNGVLDWELSIRLALIFGIALPIVRVLDKKKG